MGSLGGKESHQIFKLLFTRSYGAKVNQLIQEYKNSRLKNNDQYFFHESAIILKKMLIFAG